MRRERDPMDRYRKTSRDFTTDFGKWLDAHDREVIRRTLEQAADEYPLNPEDNAPPEHPRDWLLRRAAMLP